MSDADPAPAPVPKHPVAPRLANGPKKPHIGPDIHAHRHAHAQTIGAQSDEWWARVRVVIAMCFDHTRAHTRIFRLREKRFTGIVPSIQFDQVDLRPAISYGSPKAV